MKKSTFILNLLMLIGVACTPEPPPSAGPSEPQSTQEQPKPIQRLPVQPKAQLIDFSDLPKTAPQPAQFSDFLGSKVCAECHQEKAKSWASSTHGNAGGVPNKKTMVPAFDGRPLKFSDGTITPQISKGRYEFVVKQGGRPAQTYTIDGVIGRGHLHGGGGQTYLSTQSNGLVMTLPLEYNVTQRVWYCQLPSTSKWTPLDGRFSIESCGWPPVRSIGFAPGAACGNCHGSQIDLRFDETMGEFSTRYVDLHINCESCHGAGKRHVALMRSGVAGPDGDIGLEPLDLLDKDASMKVCMACHVNKANISGGYLAGGPYDEHMTTLSLWDPSERKDHFDGRLVEFGYQQGHLFSACYKDGSMTCVDCHDPHTLAYRDPFGRALKGRFSDGQCVGCHASKERSQHSKHKPGTEASKCTTCHMPFHQLSTVGDALPHARSDHAIPIPRPKHDAHIGVDGACNRCHSDKGITWQQTQMQQLFGSIKPLPKLVSGLFDQLGGWKAPRGTSTSATAAETLVAQHSRPESIVSVHALSLLIGELLATNREQLNPDTEERLWLLAQSPDLDLRAAALTTLLFFAKNPSPSMQRIYDTLAQSGERLPALRRKIVYGLIGVDHAFSRINPAVRQRIRSRLSGPGLQLSDGSQGLHAAIGASFMSEKRYQQAVSFLQEAVKSPAFDNSPYAMNIIGPRPNVMELLADAYGASGDVPSAEALLEKVMALSPQDPRIRHRVCRQLSMQSRFRDAERCVKELLKLQPGFIEGYFVRAQLLERTGRDQEALQSIEMGLRYAPDYGGGREYYEKLKSRMGR